MRIPGILILAVLLPPALAAQEVVDYSSAPSLLNARHHFENGFLVTYADAELALSGRTGSLLYHVTLQAPDGPLIRSEDVTVTKDGCVAVAGAWSETNYGFAVLNSSGAVTATIDTYPFRPTAITFGPDANIWLLGHAGAKQASLKRYSPGGIPLSGWPSPEPLAFLASSNSTVAMITRQGREWIEFNAGGAVTKRTRLSGLPGAVILNDANELFAFSDRLYRMDFPNNRWTTVDSFFVGNEHVTLAGEDGACLLFLSQSLGLRRVLRIPH